MILSVFLCARLNAADGADILKRSQDLKNSDSKLPEIVVTEERLVTPTKQTDETVYTGSEITRKGIDMQGSKASISAYEAISVLPGLNIESPDSRGLAAEQRNTRFRGVRGFLGSMTVEGIPNYGGNPMGPRDYIYDMENMQGIAVYKGAVPADLGTGVGSRGGALELRPKWPEKKFGFDVSQSFGSYDYSRTFMRLDTGELTNSGTRFSASYSYTDADKWRGAGELGPRHNFNIAAVQQIGRSADIKIWVNHNDLKQHLYRPLTYEETTSLRQNYKKDYNESLIGGRSQDIYYYDYNRGSYKNTDILSVITIKPADDLKITIKPYFSKEESEIFGGAVSSGGIVQKRQRDIDRYGLLSEVSIGREALMLSVGHLYESTDMVINTQNYHPLTFAFQGYGIYTENDGRGVVHTPYIKVAGKTGAIDWQTGLKYFYYKEPSSRGYTSPAPSYALIRAVDLDRDARKYDIFLPSLGLSWSASDALQLHTSYGRSNIRPYSYVPLISLYNTNRAIFQANSITLQDLFNGYKMEVTDTIEAGVRYRNESFEVLPVIFYSKHKNLLTTIYDSRVNLNYQQNISKATGYGIEIETNLFIDKNLTIFFNPTYSVMQYDQDLTYQGTTLNAKGKQVVDTPKLFVKTGLIYKVKGFEIAPSARFIGSRYGDVEHKEKIGSYAVADLKVGYEVKKIKAVESLKFALELSNILNRKYVSVINVSDDNRAGSSSYYQGAPFSVMFTASAEF
ncbi:MAG: TonB-dependent receptor [Nitrospirae bacterium]|nr:TonB-dependent receptor [Nitrospirota bacterium]